MDKTVSIVLVDTRHYRVIAQENWGLTKEQMNGKHVHHRIKRSDGGTDDPSNLYVCSEWFHDNVWHAEEGGFAGCASLGAQKAHEKKDEKGRSLHALKLHEEKLEDGRSARAVRNGYKSHEEKTEDGKSVRAVQIGKNLHAERDELGRSLRALEIFHKEKDSDGKSLTAKKSALRLNSRKYICLVTGKISTSGPLTLWQRARGIDPSLRAEIH